MLSVSGVKVKSIVGELVVRQRSTLAMSGARQVTSSSLAIPSCDRSASRRPTIRRRDAMNEEILRLLTGQKIKDGRSPRRSPSIGDYRGARDESPVRGLRPARQSL